MSRISNTVNERQTPVDTVMRQERQRVTSPAREQADVTQPKVAIVHDWLIGGGAERVVLELHKMFPEAPIYTSYATPEWREKLGGKVVTGYLQHLGQLRKFVPFLRGRWFSRLDLKDYDLIISSSGAEAKYARSSVDTLHVAYIHAPTHYYWGRYEEYVKHPGFGILDPLARIGLKVLVGPLRRWDYKAAQQPDYLIANSTFTQGQIKKYYGRDATVIHPPVDVEDFSSTGSERSGFVITGRQTPYKRFDLAVTACTKLNLPLAVVGTGPEHTKLKKLAGPSIDFKGWLSRDEVIKHVQSAEGFIFPGLDDFGISAVEAMAAGTPVIAYQAGGALDYVVEGKTGLFFSEQTADSLAETLKNFRSNQFDSKYIAEQAKKFSPEVFSQKLHDLLTKVGALK